MSAFYLKVGQNKQILTGKSKFYHRLFHKNRQAIYIQTDQEIHCERKNLLIKETRTGKLQ